MSVVTSGLCTNQGKEWPEGARVTVLVWGQLRTRSGAKAYSRRKALNSTIGPVGGVASPNGAAPPAPGRGRPQPESGLTYWYLAAVQAPELRPSPRARKGRVLVRLAADV